MSVLSLLNALDWISLGIGVLGALAALLARSKRLPKWLTDWLSRVNRSRIEAAIVYAEGLAGMTGEQRKAEAVKQLNRLCSRELGFTIPTPIAELLVEYVYQIWKRRK